MPLAPVFRARPGRQRMAFRFDGTSVATEQIEDAAKEGDLALVRKLLDGGAQVRGARTDAAPRRVHHRQNGRRARPPTPRRGH